MIGRTSNPHLTPINFQASGTRFNGVRTTVTQIQQIWGDICDAFKSDRQIERGLASSRSSRGRNSATVG